MTKIAFDNSGLVADAAAIQKGAPAQLQAFNFSVYIGDGSTGTPFNVSSAKRVTVSANSMTILPWILPPGGQGRGDELSSSDSAIIMVRFNGVGPWIGMQAPDAGGQTCPFTWTQTISFIDWYVLEQVDDASAQLVGVFGTNIAGTCPGEGAFGSYVPPVAAS